MLLINSIWVIADLRIASCPQYCRYQNRLKQGCEDAQPLQPKYFRHIVHNVHRKFYRHHKKSQHHQFSTLSLFTAPEQRLLRQNHRADLV